MSVCDHRVVINHDTPYGQLSWCQGCGAIRLGIEKPRPVEIEWTTSWFLPDSAEAQSSPSSSGSGKSGGMSGGSPKGSDRGEQGE